MSREPKRIEVGIEELEAIVQRAGEVLEAEEYEKLKAAIETLGWLTAELGEKRISLARIRRLLLGMKTPRKSEKTRKVLGSDSGDGNRGDGRAEGSSEKKKRKGHGRNGASSYTGAERVLVPHPTLASGDTCPECEEGKVYKLQKPRVVVRVKGQAPIQATVRELETLRCNLCGKVFVAPAPEGIGNKKYDETTASMIGLLKYGAGTPFYRLEKLQENLGIPLPAATQWEITAEAANEIAPAHEELIRQAAQGDVFYNDDTKMPILALMKENDLIAKAGNGDKERTGMFTTGIVSTREEHQIALYFTGRQHAGENIRDVLRRRASGLPPPIQMCDGLDRNLPKEFETVLANCLGHSRRKYVDVVSSFPEECRYVLETLGEVYKHDATTRKEKMSRRERLRYHQVHSAGLMEELKTWMKEQIEERKIEPNSSLGDAIKYMQKRWEKLTLFLSVPGAPLDNSICERALKRAVLHRKNALFYKTENGAWVGDLFMSLIHTAELSGANPFDYLTALQRNAEDVRRRPNEWMPWNYRDTVARTAARPSGPAGPSATPARAATRRTTTWRVATSRPA